MNRATSKFRNVAAGLIALERTGGAARSTNVHPAVAVCEKLRPHLATLMGKGGYRALLLRSVALANPECAWLRPAQVKADGSLDTLNDPAPDSVEETGEGGIVLIAHLFGLLAAFIGENLTLRLIREVWPSLSVSDLEVGQGDNHEKTK